MSSIADIRAHINGLVDGLPTARLAAHAEDAAIAARELEDLWHGTDDAQAAQAVANVHTANMLVLGALNGLASAADLLNGVAAVL